MDQSGAEAEQHCQVAYEKKERFITFSCPRLGRCDTPHRKQHAGSTKGVGLTKQMGS